MSSFPDSIRTAVAVGVLWVQIFPCFTQGPDQENAPVLTKLSSPVYPPIALTAHITGDIEVLLNIRKNGDVESAIVISGPPLLQNAALTSAKQSQFQCVKCIEELTAYRLFYTFRIDSSSIDCTSAHDWSKPGSMNHAPEITLSDNHITLTGQPAQGCIVEYVRKLRSLKCLYLWKCGLSW